MTSLYVFKFQLRNNCGAPLLGLAKYIYYFNLHLLWGAKSAKIIVILLLGITLLLLGIALLLLGMTIHY